MQNFPKSLTDKLNLRVNANALRKLGTSNGKVDFSSNDYLGFSGNNQIFEQSHQYLLDNSIIKNGATGSRLITGNHRLYDIAEEYIAGFHNASSALIFNSGYDANIGFFSSVPQKNDLVLYDEYIHASIRDGLRLSSAKAYKFRHNSLSDIEKLLQARAPDQGETYVVTESVFSMDGDSPDLAALIILCDKYNIRLVVDEAHATGIIGKRGEGLLQALSLHDRAFARIVTFGKALGCHGAAILGQRQLKEYLVNFARSFIYTTGLPPHSLATIITAYNHLENTEARERLEENIRFFNLQIEQSGLSDHFIKSNSAIQCAIIPGNEKIKYISVLLADNGYDIKAILSPTVPQGQERLRFCIHSYNTKYEIKQALELLKFNL